ncbi:glycoside hydrolase family 3 C-terminal domain-containing protein [Streptomyces sp. NPDC050560]|uniref:glycoside hydrolase family 3 C-terminal domain-containing protein n=1 Tax=Streptomyces sp. NPDC050560 TaxID=3365630 RepID=UPI00379DA10A
MATVALGTALAALTLTAGRPALNGAPTTPTAASAHTASYDKSKPWMNTALPPDRRADLIVEKMTLAEKSKVLEGGWPSWIGIPQPQGADGGIGIDGGLQMPAPISLAATFDTGAAQKFGSVLGKETRELGKSEVLGPTINLARSPLGGRTAESFGEDPFLVSSIDVPETKAIQDNKVIAEAKHFAANNVETNRRGLDEQIDDRTLNEMYLPAFRSVVEKGGAASLMCAYNQINGVHACDDEDLLSRTLRDRWGFDGYVASDHSAHLTTQSVRHGLDFEGPPWMELFGQHLIDAVHDGTVPEAQVDRAVHDHLVALLRTGAFDNPPDRPGDDTDDKIRADIPAVKNLAADSAVLLKNQSGVLPLDPDKTKSLAVIGYDANTTAASIGGSAARSPLTKDTVLDGIRKRVPDTDVTFAPGTDETAEASALGGDDVVPSSVLTSDDGQPGLTATYFYADDFTLTDNQRVEPNVLQSDQDDSGVRTKMGTERPQITRGMDKSVEWTGTLTAPSSGSYEFDLSSFNDSRFFLDGKLVVDNMGKHLDTPKAGHVTLKAGQKYQVRVDYWPDGLNPHVDSIQDDAQVIKWGWKPPAGTVDPAIKAAAAAAAKAQTALVVARDYSSEMLDKRDLSLPNSQNELIEQVAKANPNTIVLLTTGSAVTMPWLKDVKGVIEGWWGGSAQGAAAASVLFGDTNPSGHLPLTFPVKDSDMPTADRAQFPGKDRVAQYSEKLGVGYRGYQKSGTEPLFAFGYGQSYTSFSYSGLKATRTVDAGAAGHDGTLGGKKAATVSLKVTNTGKRTGAAVPQVYLGFPKAAGEPPLQLKGFSKVTLKPGQSKRVTIPIGEQDLAVFDTAANQWKVVPGDYQVRVGDSSDHTPLHATTTVRHSAGAPHVEPAAHPFFTAGRTTTVPGTVVNDGDGTLTSVTPRLTVPSGWKAELSEKAPATVEAHGKAEVAWKVTAPDKPTSEGVRLSAELGYRTGGKQATSTVDTTAYVPYGSLADSFDNVGVTDDGKPGAGDLDGRKNSLSAAALSDAGIEPGGKVTVGPTTFTWPKAAPGSKDNTDAYGQPIRVEGQGGAVSLLGTATAMDRNSGPITTADLQIVYTDGTVGHQPVSLNDWKYTTSSPGQRTAAVLSHYHGGLTCQPPDAGTACHSKVRLYTTSVHADAGKKIAGVVLPRLSPSPAGGNETMHVFAVGVSK